MRKARFNFKKTHIMANGKILTDEEFMSQPYVVEYEKNKEWYADVSRIYDPMYSKRELAKIEVERTAKRKEELKARMCKIREELALI